MGIRHYESDPEQVQKHGITQAFLGLASFLFAIGCIVLTATFTPSEHPLMRMDLYLSMNVFIDNLVMYTMSSQRKWEHSPFYGGAVLVFMFTISGVIMVINGFTYLRKVAESNNITKRGYDTVPIRDWSHGLSVVGYCVVLGLGFTIVACVMSSRNVFSLVLYFMPIIMGSAVLCISQLQMSSNDLKPQGWYETVMCPILAMTFTYLPWISALVKYSNYMINTTLITVSTSYSVLIIGMSVMAFLFYVPAYMALFTKCKWVWIDTTFSAHMLAFNIFCAFSFFFYAV